MTLSGIPQRPPLGVLNPHLALRAVLSRFAGEGISSLLRKSEADGELPQLARRQRGRGAQTMSYWKALMVSGSCVSSALSPPCGMEKGLWEELILFFSCAPSPASRARTARRSRAR